jgi:predicted alpha-1,2-mannosidase
MWPKDSIGNWTDIDRNNWDSMQRHYITGNIWGYSTFVPHDLPALIELKGGKQAFCKWLDSIIADTTAIGGEVHVDLSGFIGKYGHGDEPSHHFAYLYNYGGQPWKTRQLVRRVMNEMYSDTPDGLVNNEDCGQMSAWYVMSALGLYAVCPGKPEYTIGSPVFNKAVIRLDNGKKFEISATNKSYQSLFISHEQIMKGGTLQLNNKYD